MELKRTKYNFLWTKTYNKQLEVCYYVDSILHTEL